jgi:superfamily II DNA or RNA helicase
VDTDHASRLRQAIANENADLVKQNPKYVMRITGDDTEGVDQLSNFIDPESKYPVIVTTSRLLSTGVDAQTCRLIVLDREVGSMTEFKQIVGRGTRVHEDARAAEFDAVAEPSLRRPIRFGVGLKQSRGGGRPFAWSAEPRRFWRAGVPDPSNAGGRRISTSP